MAATTKKQNPFTQFKPMEAGGPVTYFFPISIGSKSFSPEVFLSAVESLKSVHSGNRIVVVLGDTLQRHNYLYKDEMDVTSRLVLSARDWLITYLQMTQLRDLQPSEVPEQGEVEITGADGRTFSVEFQRWEHTKRETPGNTEKTLEITRKTDRKNDFFDERLNDALGSSACEIRKRRRKLSGSRHHRSPSPPEAAPEADVSPTTVADLKIKEYLREEAWWFTLAQGAAHQNTVLCSELGLDETSMWSGRCKIVYTSQPSTWLTEIAEHFGADVDASGGAKIWAQCRGVDVAELTYLENPDGIGPYAREASVKGTKHRTRPIAVDTKTVGCGGGGGEGGRERSVPDHIDRAVAVSGGGAAVVAARQEAELRATAADQQRPTSPGSSIESVAGSPPSSGDEEHEPKAPKAPTAKEKELPPISTIDRDDVSSLIASHQTLVDLASRQRDSLDASALVLLLKSQIFVASAAAKVVGAHPHVTPPSTPSQASAIDAQRRRRDALLRTQRQTAEDTTAPAAAAGAIRQPA